MATLKNVADKTGYSYIYAKMVNCGLKDNLKILKAICEEKAIEIEEIEKRIERIEKEKAKKKETKSKKNENSVILNKVKNL